MSNGRSPLFAIETENDIDYAEVLIGEWWTGDDAGLTVATSTTRPNGLVELTMVQALKLAEGIIKAVRTAEDQSEPAPWAMPSPVSEGAER